MNHKTKQLIISFLTMAFLILFIIDGTILVQRCDITSDKSYKVSQVSKKTLRELENKVQVTYYLSDSVIKQRPFALTTVDLLKELAASSKGKLSLQIIDPIKKEISSSRYKGVEAWQLQSQDSKVSVSAELVYSGIVIKYGKKKEVIAQLREWNFQQIEYEVISRIKKMTSDFQMKVGILNASRRPETPPRNEIDAYNIPYSAIMTNKIPGRQPVPFFEGFTPERVELHEKIDSSFTTLIVLGSEFIDDVQLLILDQYMMKGGAILYLAENHELQLQINPKTGQLTGGNFTDFSDSQFMKYLKHYGVEFQIGKLMDSKTQTMLTKQGLVSDVFQPTIARANRNFSFNSNFSQMKLSWPDALKITQVSNEDIEAGDDSSSDYPRREILLESSKESAMSVNPDVQFVLNPQMGVTLYKKIKQQDKTSYPVALRVSNSDDGVIESYFSGKSASQLPKEEGEDALFDSIVNSTDLGQFIILSDTEMASDIGLSREGIQYIQNLVEYLGGDRELLKVRTKIAGPRLLNKIDNETTASIIKLMAMLLNLVIVPSILILFAIVWLIVRHANTKGSTNVIAKKNRDKTSPKEAN